MTEAGGPDPMIGRTLVERYRVDAPVARGGMARVYRARDARLDRDVAIKILSSPYADDPAFTERFLAEARAAASISHPSLVHVYDSGSDGGAQFIVMELLDRHRSLRQEVDARGPLPREEVVRIGRELLAGLRAVHDRGLVHCDVKSGNVMLGPGPAKLIDFGIARQPDEELAGHTSIGSLQFMSPEQLRGEALTPASDLFSLGVVLYEALTARMPFAGRSPEEVSAAHEAGAVRPPSEFADGVATRLDDAILQALRQEPGARFHTATAMERALDVADEEAASARDADETRVIATPTPRSDGYVPPAAPESPWEASLPTRAPRRGGEPRAVRQGGRWGLLGSLLILAAGAGVVFFVILPLLDLEGGGEGTTASPTATATATSAPGTVLIPETVGLATADAIDAAEEARLNWRIECAEDAAQPEGIVGQEPPAGIAVAPGSRFTMFSARFSDCQ